MKRHLIDSAADMITETAVQQSATRLVPSGSVLCVMRSGILQHSFPAAVNTVQVCLNQDLKALVPRPDMDPQFIRYYLTGNQSRVLADCSKAGTTVNSVEVDRLSVFPLPVPPRPAQEAIVARIDALFAEVAAGEDALAAAREGLGQWRQALLKAAVTGDLTADWRAANPPAETGEALLARILADRRARWTRDPRNKNKRYPEPPAPDTTDLLDLPDGWAWASFAQVCDVESDGGMKLKEKEYQAAGRWPIIDQGARPIAGYTDREELIQYPDRPWILFGDHTRRFKLIREPFCLGADGVKIIAPETQLNFDFMLAAFRAAQFEDRGYSRHFQFVRALNLPIPPLDEQLEIVRLLNEAEGSGFELDGQVADFEYGASNLRQSILAAAFRGDLTA